MTKFRELMAMVQDKPNKLEIMQRFVDIFDTALLTIEEEDPDEYHKLIGELYVAVNGPHFDEMMAKQAVALFVNEDGTTGEHWAIKDTTGVAESEGITFDSFTAADWYYVLNLMYSDYYKTVGGNIPMYISLAKDWILDKDAPAGKPFLYWKMIIE